MDNKTIPNWEEYYEVDSGLKNGLQEGNGLLCLGVRGGLCEGLTLELILDARMNQLCTELGRRF